MNSIVNTEQMLNKAMDVPNELNRIGFNISKKISRKNGKVNSFSVYVVEGRLIKPDNPVADVINETLHDDV